MEPKTQPCQLSLQRWETGVPLSSGKWVLLCHGGHSIPEAGHLFPLCAQLGYFLNFLFAGYTPQGWAQARGIGQKWTQHFYSGLSKKSSLKILPVLSPFARLKKRSQEGQTRNRMVMVPQIQYGSAWKTGAKKGKTMRVRSVVTFCWWEVWQLQ